VRGVRGYVTTGGVRDTAELRAMGFPVWARHVSAQGAVKDTAGSVNVPVVLDGVVVRPGDAVIADDDGVTIVPRERVVEAVEAARARAEREAVNRKRYEAGESSMDINRLRPVLDELGVRFVSQVEYEAGHGDS
jgi:4-hydroxy-4-methyl-2-oxoglutarate aldolase